MKKTLPFFSFLFFIFCLPLALISQEMTYSNLRDGNGISINLSLGNHFEVAPLEYRGETMHEISLSGIFLPNDEGMPNLPRISRFVAIPQGAEVRVSIKNMETQTLHNINIAPAIRIQATPEEPITDYVKDERIYTTDQFYPLTPVEVSEVTDLRGVNAVMVGITPFQYNPVTRELIVIDNIEFEIEYVGGSRNYDDPKYRSPWFDPILQNALLNYEVLPEIDYPAKGAKNGTGCEYLIVIPNREDFQPFAEQIKAFRTKQGIYTKIMRLDEMGVTTNTQFKSYIHNAYNTWDIPPVAVLLMADHNTNMALGIPAETISHPYSGTCITDNQFADVNGNLLPEMIFARMAAENVAQMTVLVSKFLEYETQPCMDPNYYKNPITALGWQTVRWFQLCSEVAGGYWRKQGKTPVRINAIYEGTPGSSWSTATNTASVVNYFGPSGTDTKYIPAAPSELGGWSGGTAAQVVTAVNNGAFALQHRDHGYESGWGEPSFSITNVNQLTNAGKMTYLFTINCQTGKFDNSTPCFGEAFHRHTYQGQNAGCVGYLGPTEVSYSFVNDAFAWGMYDQFDPAFMPSYGYQGPANANKVGYAGWMPAFGNVSGKYFLAQSSWPYNTGDKNITYQMFTAHSDVFLRIFTEVPQDPNVSHAEVSLAGNSNFMISAPEGTLIALSAIIDGNLEILTTAVATGSMQNLEIPSTLLPTTEINVVVTGQNYKRYEAIVMVVPAEGPYIVPIGYTVPTDEILTYISNNTEIVITLKNVGIEPNNPATVTIACDDPLITIVNPIGQCGPINPDGTATVTFVVTVANEVPNNKIFLLDVTIAENGKGRSWESKLSLKAYAPVFSLEKVLVNGVQGGNLLKGTVNNISTVVKNKGGADAFNVKGAITMNSPYIDIACKEFLRAIQNLPAGETTELSFTVTTSADMPFGYTANIGLSLTANYGISAAEQFTVSCSGAANYANPGNTNCSQSDKFTSVIIVKKSNGTQVLNNVNSNCASNGYQDFTSTSATLEPGVEYTLKVKVAYANPVRGWFDVNGNKYFDDNELLVELNCPTANVEYTKDFTVPQSVIPGTHRFRLRTVYNAPEFTPYSSHSYGQTHDYTLVLPDLYPSVQNVEAVLVGENIAVSWEAPATGTPDGYNIYRNGNKLNSALLTQTSFTEENLSEIVYAYKVTAVYGANESFATMSNVVCNVLACKEPVNVDATMEGHVATITWEDSEAMEGVLLGYNVFRNGNPNPINETLLTVKKYIDENLPVGEYQYQVNAEYDHCESDFSEMATVVIIPIWCEMPLNVDINILPESDYLRITWSLPDNVDGQLLGYNIYRDDKQIEELYPELNYVDSINLVHEKNYCYEVTAVYEHCSESERTLPVCETFMSIKEHQNDTYTLYPNPTTGVLNLIQEGIEISDMRYEIFDIYGKQLSQISNLKSQISNQINISHLTAGVYFVKIYSETGTVVKKVMKM